MQNAAGEQLDTGGAFDVALEIPADGDRAGPHRSGDLGARLDGQIAIDIHVPLEAARHANVAGALDLAVDCETGSDHRFLSVFGPRARRRLITRQRVRKRISILSRLRFWK